jgi:anhydro-N-acetylmuramic acid kinase
MSGTSVDSVDAALVCISSDGFELLGTSGVPYDPDLRDALLTLKHHPETSLAGLIELDHRVARTFAQAASDSLKESGYKASDVTAIGSHGQTIFHLPDSDYPGTLQLGDPSLIATLTGIDVVADFRRADMALGGQGAPLAPAFHEFALGTCGNVVLNLGGIANITVLTKPVIGFDTGPANAILDECIQKHRGLPFDDSGQWASTGCVNQPLLESLLKDDYFKSRPPKSTGTHYFNLDWLSRHCDTRSIRPQDLQRTALELTAVSIADSIRNFVAKAKIYVCGGGLKSTFLLDRIQHHLPQATLQPLDDAGVSAEACESCTFAWLAFQHIQRKPGNIPAVTGASRAAVLGALYPSLPADCRET